MRTMITTLLTVAVTVLLLLIPFAYGFADPQEEQEHPVFTSSVDSLLTLMNRSLGDELIQYYKILHNGYKAYFTGEDSLKRAEMAANLNTLRALYEADKLEMQKGLQRRNFRNTLLMLSAILALSCAIIAIMLSNTRRMRAKNRTLLKRIRELDKWEQRYEQLNEKLALQNKGEISKKEVKMDVYGEVEEYQDELYIKLKELMTDPTVFIYPCMNRKTIADCLDSNEKYVFLMIKEYYGTNISNYINILHLS